MIVEALHHVGAARSIVIDEQNRVLAGNGVLEAAAEAGILKVKTVEASGNEIIAVRRKNLSNEQKHALALFDNRAAELSEWDTEQLRADQAAGIDLTTYFRDDELETLLEHVPEDDEPAAPPARRTCGVLVTCQDADAQQALIVRLAGEGFDCKAVLK